MRRNYSNPTSFLDLLFNCLVGFVFLFVIAFLMIAPPVNDDSAIRTKAEYVITLTWSDKSMDDVDVWLEDPIGNILYYKQKDTGLMHLDRDDLGKSNDVIVLGDGEMISYEYNQEIVTIRGFIPGEWVLNIHMYSKRTDVPTEVVVRMDKINPNVNTVLIEKYTMTERWEEITVSRFTMSNTHIMTWEKDMPKNLVKIKETNYGEGSR